LGTVEVSVDAGTRETYERIKGKDVFGPVVTNLIEYAEHGDITLKYIASKDNLDDRDLDGFLDLVRTLKAKSVMVTPEWTQCHNGEYTEQHCRQIARLISDLRSMTTAVPVTQADGERLFPNGMWSEIARHVGAPSPSVVAAVMRVVMSTFGPKRTWGRRSTS
jgi:molybdenum cofactor biosynthesis enzyme MoaA